MTTLSLYMTVIPLALIPLVFLLGTFRRLVEARAKQLVRQGELVERFQSDAAKFLRLTENGDYAEHRRALVWAGSHMLDGSRLISSLIFARARWNHEGRKPSGDVVPKLPDEASHAFASATASAMLVSSYQSPIRGRYFRAALSWIFTGDRAEVSKPDQVVYRYRVASGGRKRPGDLEEAVC